MEEYTICSVILRFSFITGLCQKLHEQGGIWRKTSSQPGCCYQSGFGALRLLASTRGFWQLLKIQSTPRTEERQLSPTRHLGAGATHVPYVSLCPFWGSPWGLLGRWTAGLLVNSVSCPVTDDRAQSLNEGGGVPQTGVKPWFLAAPAPWQWCLQG